MAHLADPRRYGSGSVTDDIVATATRAAAADALARPALVAELRAAFAARLERGDEAGIARSLASMPDAESYRLSHEALAQAVEAPGAAETGVVARPFALPVVILAAGAASAQLPGQLRDVGALHALFTRCSALGPTRSFGISNALCTPEALEALSPLAIHRSVRGVAAGAIGESLPPAPIDVKRGQEQTHLRFLVGAGLTPVDAPGFAETAANIGTWGRECAKLVSEQLAAPGVQLLALPRPPRDLLSAPQAGRRAQLEAAFNLFASNAVRKLRMAVGDPTVIVSAHDGGEVRVTLSSPFADDLAEGFPWPLHPLDDLGSIEAAILDLFADMRVPDVRVAGEVLPAARAGGVPLYPRAGEWDAIRGAMRH